MTTRILKRSSSTTSGATARAFRKMAISTSSVRSFYRRRRNSAISIRCAKGNYLRERDSIVRVGLAEAAVVADAGAFPAVPWADREWVAARVAAGVVDADL